MKPKLISAPASVPVSLPDAKEHLRVFFDDDNNYIEGLIKAAVAHFDGYGGILNRCIVTQTWQKAYCRFCREMPLLFTDCSSAVVRYYDLNGTLQTVDPSNYIVSADCIRFKQTFLFPMLYLDREDRVIIESVHGYQTVPDDLILAIKILVAHWYRNREPVSFASVSSKVPLSVDALVSKMRMAF